MSAPTEPSATASEPRLPGRSSSWTRSRYEGTRNTVAQRVRPSILGDERLREVGAPPPEVQGQTVSMGPQVGGR